MVYAPRFPPACGLLSHTYLVYARASLDVLATLLCALVCFHSRLVVPVVCLSAFTRARASMPFGVRALAALALLCALWCASSRISALARVDAIRLCPRPSALTARSRHTRWFTLHAFHQPAGCAVHTYLRVRPRVSSRSRDPLRWLVYFHSRLVDPVVCLSAFTRARASMPIGVLAPCCACTPLRALVRLRPHFRLGAGGRCTHLPAPVRPHCSLSP